MNTTYEQKLSKKELLSKGWTYLNDNFHKFTEDNKIKIALTLCVKDMPTQIEGDVKGPQQIVIIKSKEEIGNPTQEVPREIPIKQ